MVCFHVFISFWVNVYLQVFESVVFERLVLADDLVSVVYILDGGIRGGCCRRLHRHGKMITGFSIQRSIIFTIPLVLVFLPVAAVWTVTAIVRVGDVHVLSLVLRTSVAVRK